MQEKEFGFNVEINNVTRDFSQGLYGNRIPLNDADLLKAYPIWNDLTKSKNINGPTFSSIEIGGAQPQVDTVFRNENYMEVFSDIRKAAPDTIMRPLWRGANAFGLKPLAQEELWFLLSQLAEDVAGKFSEEKENEKELLRIKVFDSQATIKEMESTVKMVSSLRDQGYRIGIEVAIPYSNGEELENNPYTDEFYVDKFIEAAKLQQKHNIPKEAFSVSIKDMVGELNAKNAKRLVGKIIEALKENELYIPLGLHLHNTGLATDAYAAAIEVCRKKNWPVAIDTVEGRDTGFVSMLDLSKKVDLGLTEEQENFLHQLSDITDKVSEKYKVRRVEGKLSDEQLREFKIPGGGLASFETGVKNTKLATTLGISQDDMVELAGNALIAVGHVMGEPFAVTPGFNNKQIAALNFLKNLVERGDLKKGMTFKRMKEVVLTSLIEDKEVEELFLKNLDKVVEEFLRGEMPGEVHKAVRKKFSIREGLLTDGVKSHLQEYKEVTKELQEDVVIEKGVEHFNRAVCQGIITGNPVLFRQNIERQEWYREPDPSKFVDKGEYNRSLVKFQKGLDPRPDTLEMVRMNLLAKNIDTKQAKKYSNILRREEQLSIQVSVLDVLASCNISEITHDALALSNNEMQKTGALEKAIKAVYAQQKKLINDYTSKGKQCIYLEAEWMNIALNYLAETTLALAKEKNPNLKEEEAKKVTEYVASIKKAMESSVVATKMQGKITKIEVKKGEKVEKGTLLFTMEAAKMENKIYAAHEGIISEITVNEGDVVDVGHIVMKFVELEVINDPEKKSEIVVPNDVNLILQFNKIHEQCKEISENAKIKSKKVKQELKKLECKPLQIEGNRGYNTPNPTKGKIQQEENNEYIHIVGNRAGCAVKLIGNLEQYGCNDVRILYTDGDKTTPVVKYAPLEKKIAVNSYTDQDEIIGILKDLEKNNPEKTIVFHPGWGFLAENDKFVKRLEEECKEMKIVFAGPPSKPMKLAGGKKTFRDLVQEEEVSRECNPKYFGGVTDSAKDLEEYIKGTYAKEVGKLCQYIDKNISNEAKQKMIPVINNLLGDNLSEKLSIENIGTSNKLLAKAIKTQYPNESNPLGAFLISLRSSMEENYPLDLYKVSPIEGKFSKENKLDETYRNIFKKIVEEMGGDVMLKAVAGGGGRGIKNFKYNDKEDHEAEYRRFVKMIHENIAISEKHFGDGEMLVEQCVRGNTRHLEVQMACSQGESVILGLRDCTEQLSGQKLTEKSLIEGDYPQEMIEKINKAAESTAKLLAQKGYNGVGTLEMLVVPETGKVVFLEVNTRIQVEHPVTEQDIELKTRRPISLPVLNTLLTVNPEKKTPKTILKETFDITEKDLEKINGLAKERIVHFRINSKEVNLKTGEVIPTWFGDDKWPCFVSEEIAKKYDVTIIQGDLGDGTYDPKIGAIYGNEKNVIAATKELLETFKLTQLFDHCSDKTNLESTLILYPCMFDENGKVNKECSTKTVDETLEALCKGEKPPIDLQRKSGISGENIIQFNQSTAWQERFPKNTDGNNIITILDNKGTLDPEQFKKQGGNGKGGGYEFNY